MSSQLDSFKLYSDDTPEMEEYRRVHCQLTVLGEAQRSLKWFPSQPEFAWETLQGAGIEGSERVPIEHRDSILSFINKARAKLREQEVPVFNAVQAPYFTENVT